MYICSGPRDPWNLLDLRNSSCNSNVQFAPCDSDRIICNLSAPPTSSSRMHRCSSGAYHHSMLKTIHRIGLRRKIRIEMFDRSGRKFREGNGNEMVSALLATGKESTQDEALVVVKYVRKNEVPTDNSSWVV